MKNYELLKPFYTNQFKNVFFYNELNKHDYKAIPEIAKVEKENGNDLTKVEWLYSGNEEHYLIGILENNVVSYSSEGDFTILTDDFAMTPYFFIWFKDVYPNKQTFLDEIKDSVYLQEYVKDLQIYFNWCKDQGIIIPEDDLQWIY